MFLYVCLDYNLFHLFYCFYIIYHLHALLIFQVVFG